MLRHKLQRRIPTISSRNFFAKLFNFVTKFLELVLKDFDSPSLPAFPCILLQPPATVGGRDQGDKGKSRKKWGFGATMSDAKLQAATDAKLQAPRDSRC